MSNITGMNFSHITPETHKFRAVATNQTQGVVMQHVDFNEIKAENFDEYTFKVAEYMDTRPMIEDEFRYWGGKMIGDDLSFDLIGKIGGCWVQVTVFADYLG